MARINWNFRVKSKNIFVFFTALALRAAHSVNVCDWADTVCVPPVDFNVNCSRGVCANMGGS
jgi:hypothetical protein